VLAKSTTKIAKYFDLVPHLDGLIETVVHDFDEAVNACDVLAVLEIFGNFRKRNSVQKYTNGS